MSSRRTFLRQLGGAVALGTLATTAGCTVPPWIQAGASGSGFETAETALSRAAFDDYVARMADRYGDGGVWGLGDAPDDADTTFVGAWTRQLTTGDGRDDGTGTLTVADFAVVCHRLGPRDGVDGQRHRYWLWAAAAPTASPTADTPLGRRSVTPELRTLGVGVAFSDADVRAASPDRPVTTPGVVDLAAVSSGPDGLAGRFPLATGTVRPEASVTWDGDEAGADGGDVGTDTDGYAVEWTGRHRGSQSVNAVCLTARPADADPETVSFTMGSRLAAVGYL
jgi:hypothetical protein